MITVTAAARCDRCSQERPADLAHGYSYDKLEWTAGSCSLTNEEQSTHSEIKVRLPKGWEAGSLVKGGRLLCGPCIGERAALRAEAERRFEDGPEGSDL